MRLFSILLILLAPLALYPQEWAPLLKNFEQYAEESRQKCHAVGMAVAIVKDGKVVYAKGFGQRGLDNPQAVTPETLFQIGSMTKSFTSALTALAVDRKQLEWGDLVIDLMPQFVLYDPWVTRAFLIEDLYSQRSGLISYAGDTQSMLGVSTDAMIHNIRYFQPVTSFRSEFAYQNIFFSVGAKILESVMGKTWNELIDNEFFKPLGMKSSSSDLASYLKNPNRASWHFRKPDDSVLLLPENFGYADWIYIYAPAGGINSNVMDMAKWIAMQADEGCFQGRQIISQDNLSRTHRPHVYIGVRFAPSYYCLGWIQHTYSPYPILWHNGGTSAVNNNMAIIPQERLGIVVLCNTRNTVLAEALTFKFFDLYYNKPDFDWTQKMLEMQKEAEEKEKKPPIVQMSSTLPLTQYAGTYTSPIYGDLVVTVKDKGLQAQIGPRKTVWTLKPVTGNIFSLWSTVLEQGDTRVVFCVDGQNQPDKLIVEMLQDDQSGTFVRKKAS